MDRNGKMSVSAGQPALGALAIVIALTGAFMVAAFSVGPAPTVNSGLFELGPAQGADILCVSPNPPPDWGCIFDASGTTVNLYGGIAAAFEKDPTSQSGSTDATTFSGAGTSNKNNDPVSCSPGVTTCWHWTRGTCPRRTTSRTGTHGPRSTPRTGTSSSTRASSGWTRAGTATWTSSSSRTRSTSTRLRPATIPALM